MSVVAQQTHLRLEGGSLGWRSAKSGKSAPLAATKENVKVARKTASLSQRNSAIPARRSKGMSTEGVYKTLKKAIMDMELAPGAVIDDVAIGAKLGVSRQPIREAIIRLTSEGFVESNPNRSNIVAPFDISSIRDFLDSISLIYRLTSRLAASNRRPDQLKHIQSILASHQSAIEKSDVDGVIQANREFHLAIAEAAGNSVFLGWTRNLLDHGERMMRLYLRQYENRVVDQAMDGHRKILEAIEKGDPDAAELAGEMDASIMAEGLAKFFLNNGARRFSLLPSSALTEAGR